VAETGGGGADGGVDLILWKSGEKFLVQCKQWKAFKVGVDVVRELYGVMAAKGSAGGFVVTSGRFTEEASKFASGRNISLIDGPKLQKLIRQAGRTDAPDRSPQTSPMHPARLSDPKNPDPSCPI
jgi:restriction system protein